MLKLIADLKPRNHKFVDVLRMRKRVLVKRDVGGLGDIFMHRMMFEDFKLLMPDCHITFAVPQNYFQAVWDHPFVDEVVDCKQTDERDWLVHYNTSNACIKYEMGVAPYVDKHRADIWAAQCGIDLTRHNMNVVFSESENDWANKMMGRINPDGKPTVLLAPITNMTSKNLSPDQIMPVYNELTRRGYYVFALHNAHMEDYELPVLTGTNIRHFMAIINKSDYVIAGDTAAFHLAGGLGKPTVVVSGWADAKVMGQYYPRLSIVQKHRDDDPEWTCGPCHNFVTCAKCPDHKVKRKPCLTEITSDMILAGFDKLVDR